MRRAEPASKKSSPGWLMAQLNPRETRLPERIVGRRGGGGGEEKKGGGKEGED